MNQNEDKPESLLESVRLHSLNYSWANGETACFEYDEKEKGYRSLALGKHHLIDGLYPLFGIERTEKNSPIVATGFVAYLIRHWGKNEPSIYDGFYNACFSDFKRVESKKPGAFKHDLEREFYYNHVTDEKERVKKSEVILLYLTKTDVKLIKEYVKSYFEYIEREFILRQKQKLKVLDSTSNEETKSGKSPENDGYQDEKNDINQHPIIFSNSKSWKLFRLYMDDLSGKDINREISYIYRMMWEKEKPKLIHSHIKPGMFKSWFNSHLGDHNSNYLSEIKTYDYSVSDRREKRYHKSKTLAFK